jgi:hypothetical protein
MDLRGALPVDHLPHKLDTQSASAVGLEHVDVGQVAHRHAVADAPGEADLLAVQVEADHPPGAFDRADHPLAAAAPSPVGLLADEAVDRIDVQPLAVVIQLEASRQRAPHRSAPQRAR